MAKCKSTQARRVFRALALTLSFLCASQKSFANGIEYRNDPAALPFAVSYPLHSVGGVSMLAGATAGQALVHQIGPSFQIYTPEHRNEPARQRLASLPRIDSIQTATIPGVFGSAAISMRNFPVSARWAPIYHAVVQCSAAEVCGGEDTGFAQIINSLQGKGVREKLSGINSAVNRLLTYRRDRAVYGKVDHWATPAETLRQRAGDCEDFAILKMAALMRTGIPARSMSLVVLQDRSRNVFHAVLSVSTGDGNYILDNTSDAVAMDEDLASYVPLYSFSTDRAWIHGSRQGGARTAELTVGFASVAPGEGPSD